MKFSISFYILIFIYLFQFILCTTKRILDYNCDLFQSYINTNKYNENKKLLLIFYKQNSTYCEDALNVIENYFINEYDSNSGVEFGKIDINADNNMWLHLRFKIQRLPYIILIQGNYFYELNRKLDKYSLKDFLELETTKKKLPGEISNINKIAIISNMTLNMIINVIDNTFKIIVNKNIIISILIILLLSFLWLIKSIIFLICKLCCKCRKNKKKTKVIQRKDNAMEIIEQDINKYSESLSDCDNINEDDENINSKENMPELNDDTFNNEKTPEYIINKYKNQIKED